jgi:hypothetical protein
VQVYRKEGTHTSKGAKDQRWTISVDDHASVAERERERRAFLASPLIGKGGEEERVLQRSIK